MTLNQCRMVPSGRVKVSPVLEGVRSPLQWEVWQEHLRSRPDRDYAEYLICGLREGFRIGFDYQGHKYEYAIGNGVPRSGQGIY